MRTRRYISWKLHLYYTYILCPHNIIWVALYMIYVFRLQAWWDGGGWRRNYPRALKFGIGHFFWTKETIKNKKLTNTVEKINFQQLPGKLNDGWSKIVDPIKGISPGPGYLSTLPCVYHTVRSGCRCDKIDFLLVIRPGFESINIIIGNIVVLSWRERDSNRLRVCVAGERDTYIILHNRTIVLFSCTRSTILT